MGDEPDRLRVDGGNIAWRAIVRVVQALPFLFAVWIGLLITWSAWVHFGPRRWVFADEMRHVEAMSRRIEELRRARGALPETGEILESEFTPYFYAAEPDGGYRVGFGFGFDESYEFDPATGRWSSDVAPR